MENQIQLEKCEKGNVKKKMLKLRSENMEHQVGFVCCGSEEWF